MTFIPVTFAPTALLDELETLTNGFVRSERFADTAENAPRADFDTFSKNAVWWESFNVGAWDASLFETDGAGFGTAGDEGQKIEAFATAFEHPKKSSTDTDGDPDGFSVHFSSSQHSSAADHMSDVAHASAQAGWLVPDRTVLYEASCACCSTCSVFNVANTTEGGGDTASAPALLNDLTDFLTSGYWLSNGGTVGERWHNVTDTGIDPNNGVLLYNISGYGDDTDGLTTGRQFLVRESFKLLEATLGIDFQETTSTDTNTVDFFFRDNASGAYASSSYWRVEEGAIDRGELAVSYINVAKSWSGGTSTYDDYTLQTILHEIGHALGLGHQGGYNGSATYGVDNDFESDSWQASMMSYFSQTENTSINASYEFLQTPMSVDWMALDDLYGAQGYGVSNAFAGDTIYGFNTNITSAVSDIWASFAIYANRTASTIVDGSGIDTLDLSGYSNNSVINLAPSDRGSTQPSVSDIGGRVGNLTIAEGTIIENAIGGAAGETFYGNAANNELTGNGGDDVFWDSAGTDFYFGGAGSDTVVFDGVFAGYTFQVVGTFLNVIDPGLDWIENTVEWLQFDNGSWSYQQVVDSIAPNTPPVAVNDAYSVDEDVVLNGASVLANDTDSDGDMLSISAVNGSTSAVGQQVTLTSGAFLTVGSDGTFVYNQNGAFDALLVGQTATETFTYRAFDGQDTAMGTVTITINGAFDSAPPVANNDSATVDEDVVLTGLAVLGNDNDPDGGPLTVVEIAGQGITPGGSVTLSSGALVTLNSDETLDYDQNGVFDALLVGETGNDSFTYTISDGSNTDTATVSLTINGTFDNSVPTAADDAYALSESGTLAAHVLDNDTDPDTDPLTVSTVNGVSANVGSTITLASGALLIMNTDGAFDYDTNGAFDALETGQTGTDSFTYSITDGAGGVDTATVNLSISGISPTVQLEPVLVDFEGLPLGAYAGTNGMDFSGVTVTDALALSGAQSGQATTMVIDASGEDFDLDGALLRSTGGRVRIEISAYDDGVLVGSAVVNPRANRTSDVTFDTTFDSVDQVVFSGAGTFLADDIELITRVIADTDTPSAADDAFTTSEADPVQGNLLADNGNGTDTDPNGDPLSVVSVDGDGDGSVVLQSRATVTFASDGSFSYDPNGAFDGLFDGESAADSFVYTISDGNGGTESATATVTVNGVGTPPQPTSYVIGFENGTTEDGFVFTDTVITTRATGVAAGSQAGQSQGDSLSFARTDGEDFDFQQGVFTAVSGKNVDVTIQGYDDGILVGTQTVRIRDNRETTITLNDAEFDLVDQMVISAPGRLIVDEVLLFI